MNIPLSLPFRLSLAPLRCALFLGADTESPELLRTIGVPLPLHHVAGRCVAAPRWWPEPTRPSVLQLPPSPCSPGSAQAFELSRALRPTHSEPLRSLPVGSPGVNGEPPRYSTPCLVSLPSPARRPTRNKELTRWGLRGACRTAPAGPLARSDSPRAAALAGLPGSSRPKVHPHAPTRERTCEGTPLSHVTMTSNK